jgi:hypothetical protein
MQLTSLLRFEGYCGASFSLRFRPSFIEEAEMRDEQRLGLFRGAKGTPDDVVRKRLSGIQERRKAEFERLSAIRQEMMKFRSQIEKAAPGASDPQTAKALEGLLGIHKKLATEKLAAPKPLGGIGGIRPGSISATVVPPFDYNIQIPTVLAGNQPTISGSTDKNTGQMSVSCLTANEPGFNGGSMYTTVGIYFHPVAPGTLTVRATPKYSFQWWTNSIPPSSAVRSTGSGNLNIYGVDVASQTTGATGTIISTATQQFFGWDEQQLDQINLDFGFDLETTVTTQIAVDHTLVYLLFVDIDAGVEGDGWPGSLAGAEMSATVPSISYDFEPKLVLQP